MRVIIILLFVLFFEEDGISQVNVRPLKIQEGYKFYHNLFEATQNHLDSLVKLDREGTFYVRFNLSEKGTLTNIRISNKAPGLLAEVLFGALSETRIQIEGSIAKDLFFILPVSYNFKNHFLSSGSDDNSIRINPEVDIDHPKTSEIKDIFALEDDGAFLAVPCYLLAKLILHIPYQ